MGKKTSRKKKAMAAKAKKKRSLLPSTDELTLLVRERVKDVMGVAYKGLGGRVFHRLDFHVELKSVGDFRGVLRSRCAYNGSRSAVDIQHAYVEPRVRGIGIMTALCRGIEEWCEQPANHQIHSIYMGTGMVEDEDTFATFWDGFGHESGRIRDTNIVGHRVKGAVHGQSG
jgi:GNAT superfamily N-acetyltransferase